MLYGRLQSELLTLKINYLGGDALNEHLLVHLIEKYILPKVHKKENSKLKLILINKLSLITANVYKYNALELFLVDNMHMIHGVDTV